MNRFAVYVALFFLLASFFGFFWPQVLADTGNMWYLGVIGATYLTISMIVVFISHLTGNEKIVGFMMIGDLSDTGEVEESRRPIIWSFLTAHACLTAIMLVWMGIHITAATHGLPLN